MYINSKAFKLILFSKLIPVESQLLLAAIHNVQSVKYGIHSCVAAHQTHLNQFQESQSLCHLTTKPFHYRVQSHIVLDKSFSEQCAIPLVQYRFHV